MGMGACAKAAVNHGAKPQLWALAGVVADAGRKQATQGGRLPAPGRRKGSALLAGFHQRAHFGLYARSDTYQHHSVSPAMQGGR